MKWAHGIQAARPSSHGAPNTHGRDHTHVSSRDKSQAEQPSGPWCCGEGLREALSNVNPGKYRCLVGPPLNGAGEWVQGRAKTEGPRVAKGSRPEALAAPRWTACPHARARYSDFRAEGSDAAKVSRKPRWGPCVPSGPWSPQSDTKEKQTN